MKVVEDAIFLYHNLPEHSESAGGYYKEEPIIIRGPLGTGEPVFKENEICFNGDEASGMEHETFRVTPTKFNDFCKTARKPYDLLVCAVLLSMKKHMKNFKLSSDGTGVVSGSDDWKPAKEFYEKVCGKRK